MLKNSKMKTISDNMKNDQGSKSLIVNFVKSFVTKTELKLDPANEFLCQRNVHALLDISFIPFS